MECLSDERHVHDRRNVGLPIDREVQGNGAAAVVRDDNTDHMAKGGREFRLKRAERYS